jgi:hypothetical protein
MGQKCNEIVLYVHTPSIHPSIQPSIHPTDGYYLLPTYLLQGNEKIEREGIQNSGLFSLFSSSFFLKIIFIFI